MQVDPTAFFILAIFILTVHLYNTWLLLGLKSCFVSALVAYDCSVPLMVEHDFQLAAVISILKELTQFRYVHFVIKHTFWIVQFLIIM